MNKGLAVDVGASQVGLAVGSVVAQEFDTLIFGNMAYLERKIAEVVAAEKIAYVVIGIPQSRQNSTSKTRAIKVMERLKTVLNIPIYSSDETLTTARAEELLARQGLNHQEIKRRSDQAAAKLILQQYIDENN